ncbi:NUDIX-family hydrolase [Citrobacter youngae]|nr:NUDIX-family hydrolase [Citrobacter youngae]
MVEQRRLASTEWVDIVNEDNEVIAQSSREQMRAQCLRHRATYIVVHDGMGKILVQRRTETKDFMPGMLDATAGGLFRLMSSFWTPRVVKLKKNWALPVSRLPSTVSFILKTRTVASGAGCLAAFLTDRLRCRKKKLVKCAG